MKVVMETGPFYLFSSLCLPTPPPSLRSSAILCLSPYSLVLLPYFFCPQPPLSISLSRLHNLSLFCLSLSLGIDEHEDRFLFT